MLTEKKRPSAFLHLFPKTVMSLFGNYSNMKNIKTKFSLLFLIAFLCAPLAITFADTTPSTPTPDTTPPSTPAHLNIKADVDVPEGCSATDTDGVVHNYPKGNSYLAICALETAINNGVISGVQLSNQYPSLGLFVAAINNVVADPSSQYWAILQNGNLAQLGITSLPVVAGDVIVLQLHDFSDNNLGDQVTINIRSLVVPAGSTSGPSGVTGGGYSSGGGSVSSTTTTSTGF